MKRDGDNPATWAILERDVAANSNLLSHGSQGFANTGVSSTFWRQSLRDCVYTPFNTPLRTAIIDAGRYVATAPAATFSWQATRHVSYSVIFSHWFAGDYFRPASPDQGVNCVGIWTAYRF